MRPGETFGRLTVQMVLPSSIAMVRCECGTRKAVRTFSLTNGDTRSCGCLSAELSAQRLREQLTQHGHAVGNGTPEYAAWHQAKQRVTNPNHPGWGAYGGRGIGMSPLWLNDFGAFLDHVGTRPDPSLSLDRINNDGDYEPGNVRWATTAQQAANRQSNSRPAGEPS